MPEIDAGPTPERLAKAGDDYTTGGRGREVRYTMRDSALGRAWMRKKIADPEYYALRRYALHWLAGGLQGQMGSLDLDRVFAHDPSTMSGLSKTERQADHRAAYHAARRQIGWLDPRRAQVADQVACYDYTLVEVGTLLGYQSAAHGREAACKILNEAGERLVTFWRDRDRRAD